MYLLKLALRPWRLAPWSQLLSAIAVGVLLVITGFIAWVQNGMGPVIARLEGEQVITAYLAPTVEKADEGRIVDSIRSSLGAKAVQDVAFVGTEEFLGNLKEHYPELGNEVESLGAAEAETIVPRYVSVSGVVSDTALQKLKKIPGIEGVESSKDRYGQVIVAYKAVSWVAQLFIIGLGIALLTGLVHLSRVNSHFYEDVLGFLRLWGAGRISILLPGALSGLIVGLLGGVLAFSGWFFGSAWLAAHLRDLSPALKALPMVSPRGGLLFLVCGAVMGAAAGMLAGWWASDPRGFGSGSSSGGRKWI